MEEDWIRNSFITLELLLRIRFANICFGGDKRLAREN